MRIASAIPSPIAGPCPREPVAASTHGSSGVGAGWPWIGDPNRRSVIIVASSIAPTALSAAYSSGAA